MSVIRLFNLISVGIFGMVLSALFCDICWTRKNRLLFEAVMAVIFLLQGILYFRVDADLVERLYPLVTHLPLAVVLCLLGRKILWPVISVLTAYLCCQLRHWLALLLVVICSGGQMAEDLAELLLTVPMLILLLRFAARPVRFLSHYPRSVQVCFGLVPAVYYCFDYATRVYTNLVFEGGLFVAEFMPSVCSGAYLAFVYYISKEGRIRGQLEETCDSLDLQVTQAVREIDALREAQRRTRAYRHDMRHHMQYILSCMENGRSVQAQEYIRGICSQIDAAVVVPFCENESANLIFSSFAERAKKSGVAFEISANIPQVIAVSENDLCVLLSNALENAIYACRKVQKDGKSANIEVSAYEENGTIFVQIVNTCGDDVVFYHGIPVTGEPGHGIGVQSICAIVEQYGGLYSFSAKDHRFILRVSLRGGRRGNAKIRKATEKPSIRRSFRSIHDGTRNFMDGYATPSVK